MDFKDLIKQINDVVVDVSVKEKFDLFNKISQFVGAKINVSYDIIYDLLRERELLGSTAIGNGFALPHLKLKGIKPYTCVFVLKTPIDFDSVDNIPVSVIFAVLSPSDKPSLQLKTLTLLAKMLKKAYADFFLNKSSDEIKNYLKTFEEDEKN